MTFDCFFFFFWLATTHISNLIQRSLYFTTLYFKTTLDLRPLDLVPKGNELGHMLLLTTSMNIYIYGESSGRQVQSHMYISTPYAKKLVWHVANDH